MEFRSVYEGTTGIAAINLERQFIGIEQGQQLFNIAKARIEVTISLSKIRRICSSTSILNMP
jgi:DNA modification methylase